MTGGQRSILRILFGTYLLGRSLLWLGGVLFHGVDQAPQGSSFGTIFFPTIGVLGASGSAALLLSISIATSLALLLGFRTRVAAVLSWWVSGALLSWFPESATDLDPILGIFVLLLGLRKEPGFGSLDAQDRIDPRDPPFRFARVEEIHFKLLALDRSIRAAVFLIGAARHGLFVPNPSSPLFYEHLGALALVLAFPLAFVARLERYLWLVVFVVSLALGASHGAEFLTAIVVAHLAAVRPAWFPEPRSEAKATVLYDGNCGLCHGAVRFVLAEDEQERFLFAPLFGETFERVESSVPKPIPDSLMLIDEQGLVSVKSTAVFGMLLRLGGFWKPLGRIGLVLPLVLRDGVYDFVARIRHRLFKRPKDVCPILPRDLRARFLP